MFQSTYTLEAGEVSWVVAMTCIALAQAHGLSPAKHGHSGCPNAVPDLFRYSNACSMLYRGQTGETGKKNARMMQLICLSLHLPALLLFFS